MSRTNHRPFPADRALQRDIFPAAELHLIMHHGQMAIKLIRELFNARDAKKYEQVKNRMRNFISEIDQL